MTRSQPKRRDQRVPPAVRRSSGRASLGSRGDPGLASVRGNLADLAAVAVLFVQARQERVVCVAAHSDARASSEDSCAYCDANIVGFNDVHK